MAGRAETTLGDVVVWRYGLVGRAGGYPRVLVEAPGGFGKSTFARQLAASFEVATAVVAVDAAADADVLLGLVVEAVRRAG